MIKWLIRLCKRIWLWYKKKWIDGDHNINLKKLKWVRASTKTGRPFEWRHVDTIEFDIESIKTKKEVIIDMEIPTKEAEQECTIHT